MDTYSNIIERWHISFKHLSIAWKRKYKTFTSGRFKGEKRGKVDTAWGVDESIIGQEYYKNYDFGRLTITYHRTTTKKDWDKLVYKTNV